MKPFIPEDVNRVNVKAGPDAVLIDDDPLICMGWQMRAERAEKVLWVFSQIQMCRSKLSEIHRKTPMFIDSELGGETRGETFAEELHKLGYSELYLVTGHSPETFANLTFIKKVLEKSPPEWLFGPAE